MKFVFIKILAMLSMACMLMQVCGGGLYILHLEENHHHESCCDPKDSDHQDDSEDHDENCPICRNFLGKNTVCSFNISTQITLTPLVSCSHEQLHLVYLSNDNLNILLARPPPAC